ncbi:MAG: hypothetical protein V4594_06795 [Bacteroidota bacterium]
MNFLSHYYFDKNNQNENIIMGVVLPDLVKNAQKDLNLYPLKEKQLFEHDEQVYDLLKGWQRHIQVDAIFHSSEFFKVQTGALKQELLPALEGSPVKPFFLAHIALELLLDHLLIVDARIDIHSFYDHLSAVEPKKLDQFLINCDVTDTRNFFSFLNGFISGKYLLSYQKLENIAYALNRICMRLWDDPFSQEQLVLLTRSLHSFKETIHESYFSVFEEIESQLKSTDSQVL